MASRIVEQTDSAQVTVSVLLPLIFKLKFACCFMSIYKPAYFFLTWNIICLKKSISSQPHCTSVQERKTVQTTEQWKNAFVTLYSVIPQLRQEKPSIVIWAYVKLYGFASNV